jgi:ABC-type branched-subunit amino acid transport system ATPase component
MVLENGLVAITGEAKELLQSDQVKESYLGL